MTLDSNEAFALYFEGDEAHGRGDLDAAIAAWDALVKLLDEHDVEVLESDHGALPRVGVRTNLAALCQATKRWSDMRGYAEQLVAEHRNADHLQLLATALKNDGDPARAREVIEEAVRLDPGCSNAHHEHACILAAAGELEAALQAMDAAIGAGASPQSLKDDDELSMMADVAGFDRVMSAERWVEARLSKLAELATALGTFQTQTWGQNMPSDAEIETFDEAVEVTREILGAAFAQGAPRDPQGRIVLAECSELQRRVVDELLSLEPLWKAIPFLNLIGEIGVPNTTVADARHALRPN